MNIKAWIKLVEAFFGILIILGVLVLFYSSSFTDSGKRERIHSYEKTILEEISSDSSLREAVVANNIEIIEDFSRLRTEKILPGFNVTIKICDPGAICNLDNYPKEVYSEERIISSTLDDFSPKKIKIFIWLEK